MGLYKELAYEIENLGKKQKQIYINACDFGIPVKTNDANFNKIKDIIKEAGKSFIITRKQILYGTGKTITVSFVIPWEKDGDMYCGTKYIFEYVSTRSSHNQRDHDAYISIECKCAAQKESPFKSN